MRLALSCRVAAPYTKWEHGRLSVRFPLRRGADLSAVLAEVAAQLGGGGGRKGLASPAAAEGGVEGAGCPALEGEVVTKACARTPCHCEEVAFSSSAQIFWGNSICGRFRAPCYRGKAAASGNKRFCPNPPCRATVREFRDTGVVRDQSHVPSRVCRSGRAEGLLACVDAVVVEDRARL